jgi:hypothetical protein
VPWLRKEVSMNKALQTARVSPAGPHASAPEELRRRAPAWGIACSGPTAFVQAGKRYSAAHHSMTLVNIGTSPSGAPTRCVLDEILSLSIVVGVQCVRARHRWQGQRRQGVVPFPTADAALRRMPEAHHGDPCRGGSRPPARASCILTQYAFRKDRHHRGRRGTGGSLT